MFASHLATPVDQAPERDLACVDLWERSIERSRRRRDLAAVHRKHAPRRKASSLALSAALLASPVVPLASAQSGGSGGAPSGETGPGDSGRTLAGDAILRAGDTGSAVAAVQRKLAIDDDGIFGPQTQGAVKNFQGRVGLPVTGAVDSRTWTELFRAAVSYVPEGSAQAKAIQASFSGDAAPAKSEERASAAPAPADPSAGAEQGASDDGSGQADGEHAHATRVSGDDGSQESGDAVESGKTAGDQSRKSGEDGEHEHRAKAKTDDKAKSKTDAKPGPREGGSRPTAGVDKSSEDHEHDREGSTTVKVKNQGSVSVGGDCGTGKLASPAQGTVTGGFGDGRNHAGIDIANATGTPIYAALCGTVTEAGVQSGYGNIVCIRHTSSFSTCYAHLSSFNTREGEYVKIGQMIARMGSTGRSTGPHLHFETRVNGRAQDPSPYLSGQRTVSGTSTGGAARAASTDSARTGGQRASSTSTSSGEIRTASTQQAQYTGTGGATPPGGTAADAGHVEPQTSQVQPAAQQEAPAEQQAAVAPEQTAAPEQAPAEEQAPALEEVQVEVAAQAPAGEAPVEEAAAPVEEAAAPVEEATEDAAAPVAGAVEEAAAPVEEATDEAAAPVEEAAAPVEEAAAPVEEAVEEAAAPVEEAAAPVAEAVEEAAAPVEEAAAPVAEPAAPAVPGAAG